MIKTFSRTWIFILFIITACNNAEKKLQAVNESASISLDKIKLTGLNGRPFDLSGYKGKTVFINFWATWCKPCVQEMPSLQRLTEKLRDKNIAFLFASDEPSDVITDFKESANYTMDFLQAESLADLNIMGLPTTFIFDKNGQLAFSEMGARNWDSDEIVTEINKILDQ